MRNIEIRLTGAIVTLLMCLSCSNTMERDSRKLALADSLLEEHPDSVIALLDGIGPRLQEDDAALYGLLFTAARYKCYQPSDTGLINRSIGHYRQTADAPRLATSLYYKGAVIYDLGHTEEATLCLKQAENVASHLHDEPLKNKIFDFLAYLNFKSGNYELDLLYSKKFLESSLILGDTLQVARAYDYLATSYSKLGMADSMRLTQQACVKLAEKTDAETQALIFSNVADSYIREGTYEDARRLLVRAMSLKPMASQYVMLGRVCQARQDTTAARSYWEEALTFNDMEFSIKAHELLSALYHERGDEQLSRSHEAQALSLTRQHEKNQKGSAISYLQHRFDTDIVQKSQRKSRSWLVIVSGLLATVVIAFVGYMLRRRREKSLIVQVSESNHAGKEQDAPKPEPTIDTKEDRTNDDESNNMKVKTEKNAQVLVGMASVIGQGEQLWNVLMRERTLPHFSDQNMEAVLAYYAYIQPEKYSRLTSDYDRLSPRYLLFLVLRDEGFTYAEFATLMCLTPSAVRNYPSRIEKHRRQ